MNFRDSTASLINSASVVSIQGNLTRQASTMTTQSESVSLVQDFASDLSVFERQISAGDELLPSTDKNAS